MKINLIQLGAGNIGRELISQILNSDPDELGVELVYCGLFTSSHGVFHSAGLSNEDLENLPINGLDKAEDAVAKIAPPFIVVDVTPSNKTLPLLRQALQRGGGVVSANKHPLSGPQSDFDELIKAHPRRLYFEATVGAGLPVVSTIRDLMATGDKIERLAGCFSGTLGYIFSALDSGVRFSQVVTIAKQQGFTEPDPRDDLAGADVGRKAVILARLLGQQIELIDIPVESLYPESMSNLSVDEFMSDLKQLDAGYEAKIQAVKAKGQVLRYLATVTPTTCKVELKPVDKDSELGQLSGPDNIIIIRTKRYHDNPIIIKGPGAGVPVTASGVFADILKASQIATGTES